MKKEVIDKAMKENVILINDVKAMMIEDHMHHVPVIPLVMSNFLEENKNIITLEEIGSAYLALHEEYMNKRYTMLSDKEKETLYSAKERSNE